MRKFVFVSSVAVLSLYLASCSKPAGDVETSTEVVATEDQGSTDQGSTDQGSTDQ